MATMQDTLRWGILGTGKISTDFCTALKAVKEHGHQILAIASRDVSHAKTFALDFNIDNHYGSYLDLCSDPNVDVVYVGTVTSDHYSSTIMALNAGKHVLCEKPMATNLSQSKEIIQLAKSQNLLFVEGLWSKFLPSYDKIREELRNKTIGEVVMVSIEFGLNFDQDSRNHLLNRSLGGGTALNLGCYAIHLANIIFNCERPVKIEASGNLHSTGLDKESQITLIYPGEKVAQISLSIVCDYANEAIIFGKNGFIKVKQFWCCEEVECPSGTFTFNFTENTPKTNYPKTIGFKYEIERVREAIKCGRLEIEEISHDDSLIASEILESISNKLGQNYREEEPKMSTNKTIGWGIIGTGKIANDFCLAVDSAEENKHRVVAVASRNLSVAKKFSEKHNISQYYEDYLQIAKVKEVDIVYIATVNSLHAKLSKFFLSTGKAVLCEKPMSMSYESTAEVIECAKQSGILFVEGFWTRFFPAYKQLKEELQKQTIGKIRLVSIQFGIQFDWEAKKRLSKKELGGGVMLDIGCYAIQLACMIFENKYPLKIVANGNLYKETGVDQNVAVTLMYDDDASVQILVSGTCKLSNSAIIYGTNGKFVIPSPFWCPEELQTPTNNFKFKLPQSGKAYEFMNSQGLIYEINSVGDAFLNGLKETAEINHDESLKISKIQQEILNQLGSSKLI